MEKRIGGRKRRTMRGGYEVERASGPNTNGSQFFITTVPKGGRKRRTMRGGQVVAVIARVKGGRKRRTMRGGFVEILHSVND